MNEGVQALSARGLRSADARDFAGQAVSAADIAGADSVVLPEIGVAIVAAAPAAARGMSVQAEIAADSAIASIDPEYFVFVYSRWITCAGSRARTEAIDRDLGSDRGTQDAGLGRRRRMFRSSAPHGG